MAVQNGRVGGLPFSLSPLLPRPSGRRRERDRERDRERTLLEADFRESGRLAAETDRNAFVVGDHREAVLPDQIPQPGDLVRLATQVDLAVDHASAVEILT